MLQLNGFRPENDHCYSMPRSAVSRTSNFAFSAASSRSRFRVHRTRQSSLFDIHVQVGDFEDDEEDTRRGESSFNLSDERNLGVFERTNGSLSRYGREILQELIERFSDLRGNPKAPETERECRETRGFRRGSSDS